jgi:PAS domain-containing protein
MLQIYPLVGGRKDGRGGFYRSAQPTEHRIPGQRYAREDDRWLRSVLENSSEIMKIVDLDGTLRHANPAFERVLGHDPEEVVGKMNVLDFVHPDDLPCPTDGLDDASRRGRGIMRARVPDRVRKKPAEERANVVTPPGFEPGFSP